MSKTPPAKSVLFFLYNGFFLIPNILIGDFLLKATIIIAKRNSERPTSAGSWKGGKIFIDFSQNNFAICYYLFII
ncbi:hypothetical protein [Candidatus Avelusimicrobium fimicolum]|uniref:hypothetical protein n=1 Tax=Candidatus Avelusimicrobium fimicolum TaxID=3416216 RepID=UPI0015B08C0D